MQDTNYNKIFSIKSVVSCDGSVTKSPHPLVYLNTEPKGKVTCPYCNLMFIKQDNKQQTK